MLNGHQNYRSYLKDLLAERVGKNSSYSLRALARQLDLQPSHLCAVLKGTKKLSAPRAFTLAQKLGLSTPDAEYFCLLVEYDHARTPDLKDALLGRMRALNQHAEVKDLSIDLFKAISAWYHIPILEMTSLDDFEFTPSNVAERLGISRVEAETAFERLERLELIERDEEGKWHKVHANAMFRSEVPNSALRQFHRHMMQKASESLETQTPQERYVGSQTFSIDVEQFEDAKKLTDEYRRSMVALFNSGKKRTETYHLGIQLFNLTKNQPKIETQKQAESQEKKEESVK